VARPNTSSQKLELELIQSHMTQKPVLRGEVDARALRVKVRLWVGGDSRRGRPSRADLPPAARAEPRPCGSAAVP